MITLTISTTHLFQTLKFHLLWGFINPNIELTWKIGLKANVIVKSKLLYTNIFPSNCSRLLSGFANTKSFSEKPNYTLRCATIVPLKKEASPAVFFVSKTQADDWCHRPPIIMFRKNHSSETKFTPNNKQKTWHIHHFFKRQN